MSSSYLPNKHDSKQLNSHFKFVSLVCIANCPEESSWGVGDCLKKLDSLPESCSAFIKLHDACKSEIETTCDGKEYTADVVPCLTEWNQITLSDSCQSALPQKVSKRDVDRRCWTFHVDDVEVRPSKIRSTYPCDAPVRPAGKP